MSDYWLTIPIFFLITLSLITLSSIAPFLFPLYFVYIVIAISAFYFISKIDFEVWTVFYKYAYIISIFFLILPLVIGEVTRGAIRWIPIGSLSLQPAELVRPFLLIFFSSFLTRKDLTLGRLIKAFFLLLLPLLLIIVQPSLGVAIITFLGFIGILLASSLNKKIIFLGVLVSLLLLPLSWFLLAPYQKARIITFLKPFSDSQGAGYNSLQSMIAVGSGKITGRGLGQGVQTQLSFLPERHTDFIFASIAEEMGLIGSLLTLAAISVILLRITYYLENAENFTARAFVSGVFLALFVQVTIHIGMNMAIFPITGLPLPLVSAGGSSLLATMVLLAMVVGAVKKV